MQKDPGYVKTLEALPEDRRRAYLYGDWDVFAGQYFPEFDRRLHVTEPFAVPKAWRRYVTLDYGLDMLAAYWIAVDLQGFAYVYRELYEKDLIISEAAERLLAMTGEEDLPDFGAARSLEPAAGQRQERGGAVLRARAAADTGEQRPGAGVVCAQGVAKALPRRMGPASGQAAHFPELQEPDPHAAAAMP